MTRWPTCVISSVSMHRGGIAIIGGGWSGLACAVTLRQRSDTPITLFESAPALGGRARGLIWEGLPIDNGQHLTIGAYRATFDLLASVGAPAWRSEPLRWSGVGHNLARNSGADSALGPTGLAMGMAISLSPTAH